MSTLNFTPAAGAAPFARRVWAQATTEAGLILRNGEQAILAIVIPVAVLIGAKLFGDRLGLNLQEMAPSVLALVIWSTCLTTLAIANLLYLVGMPLGILLPVDRFPGWAQTVINLLPTGALGETLRQSSEGVAVGWPLLVVALWCVGTLLLARKVFTWTS